MGNDFDYIYFNITCAKFLCNGHAKDKGQNLYCVQTKILEVFNKPKKVFASLQQSKESPTSLGIKSKWTERQRFTFPLYPSIYSNRQQQN